jgi:peptidoglycan hydrolase-like protein with peptidoglycan-binding domain
VSRHFVRLVRHANQLKVGSCGRAVEDVQRALGIEPSGVYGKDTRRAVFVFQHDHNGLTANGIVDPHTWYRLFPDEPLRPTRTLATCRRSGCMTSGTWRPRWL